VSFCFVLFGRGDLFFFFSVLLRPAGERDARATTLKNPPPTPPPTPNKTPTTTTTTTGSFNAGKPVSEARNPHGKALFEAEHAELLGDLLDIPARACDRRVNEFVKRVRALRVHMLLIGALRKKLPAVFGKERAMRRLLDELPATFAEVQAEHRLPTGDFPDLARFRAALANQVDLSKMPTLTPAMQKQVDAVLNVDIPALVRAFENPF
jgi:EH domain-containing protein 1